jgi:hypothetical protein
MEDSINMLVVASAHAAAAVALPVSSATINLTYLLIMRSSSLHRPQKKNLFDTQTCRDFWVPGRC